jgi:hypothetical protein
MKNKEYLTTLKVVVIYQMQCFADRIEDLRNIDDNRHLLPEVTRERLKNLEITTGLVSNPWGEMIDRYSKIEEIISVDDALWGV